MNPDAFIHTDVYGTYVLLEAARNLGNLRYSIDSESVADNRQSELMRRHGRYMSTYKDTSECGYNNWDTDQYHP